MPNSAQLMNQDSGNTEYYTPVEIINAARLTMGGIDFDPASSAVANQRVRATRFYTEADDGLSLPWNGRVWMNHPFGRKQNPLWIDKLVRAFTAGDVEQACCITFAATSERWFQPLLYFPQCFLTPRTHYYLPDGSLSRKVPKGSVVTYLGSDLDRFIRYFGHRGRIK